MSGKRKYKLGKREKRDKNVKEKDMGETDREREGKERESAPYIETFSAGNSSKPEVLFMQDSDIKPFENPVVL